MTSSYSNTSVFFRPIVNEKPAFSKISTEVFEKMRFRWPFSSDTCGRYAKADEKKSPFSSKKGYVWTGPKFCITFVFFIPLGYFSRPKTTLKMATAQVVETSVTVNNNSSIQLFHIYFTSVLFRTTFSRTIPLNLLFLHSFLRGRVSYCLSRRNFIFQAKGPQWPGSVVPGVNSGLQRVRQQTFWRWFYRFPVIRVVMKVSSRFNSQMTDGLVSRQTDAVESEIEEIGVTNSV